MAHCATKNVFLSKKKSKVICFLSPHTNMRKQSTGGLPSSGTKGNKAVYICLEITSMIFLSIINDVIVVICRWKYGNGVKKQTHCKHPTLL